MHRYRIPQLGASADSPFPDPSACQHPEGLLAWGGGLEPERLLRAYQAGIFPWYGEDSPILWWSPEPRAIMLPGQASISRRLERTLRQARFAVSMDLAFAEVIDGCAAPRQDEAGTWITPQLRAAFIELHRRGLAHSFEVWMDGELAGGVYGLALGKIFFAESKFHRRRDASKIALVLLLRVLQAWDFLLLDCQIWNPHLERLGVHVLDRPRFQQAVARGTAMADEVGSWTGRLAALGERLAPVAVLSSRPQPGQAQVCGSSSGAPAPSAGRGGTRPGD